MPITVICLAAYTDAQCVKLSADGFAPARAELVKRALMSSEEQHAEARKGAVRSKDGWRDQAWGGQ